MSTPSSLSSRFLSRFGILLLTVGIGLGLVGCDGGGLTEATSGNQSAPVSVSVSSGAGAEETAKAAAGSQTYTDSLGNTLRLDDVEVVLREIEFDRADGDENCSASGSSEGDDSCEEVESGPLLVSLPLDGSTPDVVIDTTLPTGRWEEAEFEVHTLDPTLPADSALLDEEDFPANVSIRAEGAFTPANESAEPFTFTSDLDAEREIQFTPPLEVTADGATNVTFAIEVTTWFRQQDSTLIDPAQAGDYEDLIEENIEASIEGFEDEDHDGKDDGDEDEGDEDEDDEDEGDEDEGDEDEGDEDDGDEDDGDEDDGDDDGEDDGDGDDDDDEAVEVEKTLTNTGADSDASGEAEFEQESSETEFRVEVEHLDTGTYDLIVADTTRGELDVVTEDDGTEGAIEFKDSLESGHPLLNFDPRGKHVEVAKNETVYLEADFPTSEDE